MASTSTTQKKKATAGKATLGKGSLSDHPILLRAIKSFISTNCVFQSSVPLDRALEEVSAARELGAVFAIPIQNQIFSMEGALSWLQFLSLAPERATENGDKVFATGGHTADKGLTLINEVYDNGVEESVWEHFEDDDEDEEDDDE